MPKRDDIYADFINPLRRALRLDKVPYTNEHGSAGDWMPDAMSVTAPSFWQGAIVDALPFNNRRQFKREGLLLRKL